MISWRQIRKEISSLFWPISCSGCGAFMSDELEVFCTVCIQKLEPIAPVDISINQKYTLTVHAASNYKAPVKSLILAKSRSDIVASKRLAYLIWARTIVSCLEFDCIVPVPLHWLRYAQRGYNQSAVMAYYLAKISKKPVLQCVSRTRNTMFQSQCDAHGRLRNVKDCFRISPSNQSEIWDKRILIIDDLMTTGITLKEMTTLLYKNNVSMVKAVVAARVV
jgi:ComF family protein